jgi:hypothetical protein
LIINTLRNMGVVVRQNVAGKNPEIKPVRIFTDFPVA